MSKAKIARRKPAILAAEMVRHDKWRLPCRKRRYSSLRNTIGGVAKWMASDGYVGDKIVIYDIESGLEAGTARLSATGHLITKWITEEK